MLSVYLVRIQSAYILFCFVFVVVTSTPGGKLSLGAFGSYSRRATRLTASKRSEVKENGGGDETIDITSLGRRQFA